MYIYIYRKYGIWIQNGTSFDLYLKYIIIYLFRIFFIEIL